MTGTSDPGKDKRVFITGASGFIGSRVSYDLTQLGWDIVPVAADVRSTNAVNAAFQTATSQDAIIHAAALSNVDWCENHPKEAVSVNVAGTRNVAAAAKQAGARLIFFSSEYVFDGQAGPYDENSQPNPISEYGKQKLSAEKLIGELCSNYLIIRMTTVFGYEEAGKNFLMSCISRMQTQPVVQVPDDQISTPTYVEDIARITADLAGRPDVQGILNIAGPDLMSRTDFATAIVEAFGLDLARLQPVSTAELEQPARRPLKAGLKIDRLKSLGYTTTNVKTSFSQIKTDTANQDVSGAILRAVSR